MCGICGFFGGGSIVSEDALTRMNDSLARRGPDDSGIFRDAGAGLAMRRLSIIDLDGGHQPIHNEDGTVWVVMNGEIYNYRELRASLVQQGHRFHTDSDTEVIVHLYEEHGDALVHRLRGMFAFALWDSRRKRGLVVRDRLGIKPLFYACVNGTLLFGSEIKALLASGIIDRDLDYQALDAFMTYTYIPAPLTIYRGVRKLEAGHLLVWDADKLEDRVYWDIDVTRTDAGLDGREWLSRFDLAISDAVRSHMVSDVPVGAFLSGGIDSSLVVALMSQHIDEPVQTFTIGFGGTSSSLIDERPLARQVAKRYGCSFREQAVQPEFRQIVGEIVDAFDEPFADDSVIPTYYVSQFARRSVKVAMSGLGGDELFAGYERYAGVVLSQYYARLVPKALHRHIVKPLVQRLPEPSAGGDRIDHAKRFAKDAMQPPAERYLGFVSTVGSVERRRLYTPDTAARVSFDATDRIVTDPFSRCAAPDELTRALYTDMKTYLPEDILSLSDRLGMWHSLEVRVPLVDHHLVELSTQLPTRYKLNLFRKKHLLKRLAARHLPPEILGHRKQGFEAPMAAWLRKDIADYAREILCERRVGSSGIFDTRYVSEKLEEHFSGRRRNSKLLFSLIMFQEWYERHLS